MENGKVNLYDTGVGAVVPGAAIAAAPIESVEDAVSSLQATPASAAKKNEYSAAVRLWDSQAGILLTTLEG
ncbi:hypothetical protein H1R20_g8008, partial [Candolleomyces eurysporus]